MNEKMRGINIQEKASMCGKCKMWLVMVVFALATKRNIFVSIKTK